jgi:hypothetical protein
MCDTAIGIARRIEHVEEPVAAASVDAVPLGIDEQIVGIAAYFDACDGRTLTH